MVPGISSRREWDYIIVIANTPHGTTWQDLKDTVRQYARNVRQAYDCPGALGHVTVATEAEARRAFEGLTRDGWGRRHHPIKVSLLRQRIGTTESHHILGPTEGPLVQSQRHAPANSILSTASLNPSGLSRSESFPQMTAQGTTHYNMTHKTISQPLPTSPSSQLQNNRHSDGSAQMTYATTTQYNNHQSMLITPAISRHVVLPDRTRVPSTLVPSAALPTGSTKSNQSSAERHTVQVGGNDNCVIRLSNLPRDQIDKERVKAKLGTYGKHSCNFISRHYRLTGIAKATFETALDAGRCVQEMHGWQYDERHVLTVEFSRDTASGQGKFTTTPRTIERTTLRDTTAVSGGGGRHSGTSPKVRQESGRNEERKTRRRSHPTGPDGALVVDGRNKRYDYSDSD